MKTTFDFNFFLNQHLNSIYTLKHKCQEKLLINEKLLFDYL